MHHAIARPGLLVAALVVLLCGIAIHSELHAAVNTITVNNLTDPAGTSGNGFCTLREAINNANSPGVDTTSGDCVVGTGTDMINFSVSGTITLGSTLPAVANTLSIDGTGQSITVDGANLYRVMSVASAATLSLNSLTIAHGNGGGGDGGGISNVGTSLTITNCIFSGNSAPGGGGRFGGAIFSGGGSALTVDRSVFSNNSAGDSLAAGSGGAIGTDASPITINNSTFSGNSATVGGGIFDLDTSSRLTVSNSTFTGNSAVNNGSGGGIACYSGVITNSTFTGNSTTSNGGGVACNNAMTVNNSTFSGNAASSGGAVYITNGTLTITNSVLASSAGGNCGALFASISNGGDNISDDGTCAFGTSTGASGQTIGDNVNPLLDTSGLQNNGGPTQTIALQASSPAIDAIPAAQCPATDQRGVTRPDAGEAVCDIGAYELVDMTTVKLSTTSLTFKSQKVGTTSMGKTVKLSNTGNATLSIASIVASGDFAQTNNCGASVAVKKSCSISVSFKPTQIGTRSGTLAISDNAAGSPQTVGLSGTGK